MLSSVLNRWLVTPYSFFAASFLRRIVILKTMRFALALAFLSAQIAQPLLAVDYYWEPVPSSGNGDDVLDGGGGTWNTTTANFTTSPTDSSATTHNVWSSVLNGAGTDTLIFGGAAGGTVTLNTFASGAQISNSTTTAVNNLTFNTDGYTLSGSGTLRFVNNGAIGGSITVGSGLTATISNGIQGSNSGALVTGAGSGQVDNNVEINGGGTLRLSGNNGSIGFTIDGNTTVEVFGGTFSGFNDNTINAGSTLRVVGNNRLSQPSTFSGGGLLDLNGTAQTISTIGGALSVNNSTSTASNVFNLSVNRTSLVHTGNISNGAGKLSLATIGILQQGNNFNNSSSFAQQTFAGANTYTGSTTHSRGTIELNFANAASPSENILYNAGFVGNDPNADDGVLFFRRSNQSIDGANEASDGSLATLRLVGSATQANSQTFNGTILEANSAASIILLPNTTTPQALTLDLGALDRDSGSVINFGTTNITTVLDANSIVRTSTGTASSLLTDINGVAYATIGGTDWAAKNAANDTIVAATYTNSTTTGFTTGANITTIAAGGAANDIKLSANTSIASLRYSSTARTGIELSGTTLTTGGILVSPINNSSGSFLSGGSVTTPGADLTVVHYRGSNSRWFGLDAVVANGANGAIGLTKSGNGTTQLLANNTFSGALNVHEGGLIITGTNDNVSAVFVNGSQSNAMGSQLPGQNTNGSYIQLGNSNASGSLGSAEINLGVQALLAVKRSDDFTLTNNVSGLGGLTQGGTGTTTLLADASFRYRYAGDTTVTAGTLKLDYAASNNSIISNNSRIVLGGGTLEYAGVAGTTHAEVFREALLISGGSTLTKTGGEVAGRFRLNTFNGNNAGATLNIMGDSIADSDSNVTNGILTGQARITVTNGSNVDWATKVNGGDTVITGTTAYTAAATSGTNTLQSRVQNASLALTANTTTNTLKIENTSGNLQTVNNDTFQHTLTAGGLLVTGIDAVEINGGTLRSNTTTNSDLIIHQYNSGGLTINSTIVNGAGASTLTKSGSGDLTLTGTNTYTGQTYLNGGVTTIAANANLGAEASGQTLNLNNATLRVTSNVGLFNGAVGTNNRAINLNGAGGTFDVGAGATLTTAGTIAGPGELTKIGTGTLQVRTATYTGPTNVNAGVLQYGSAGNPLYSAIKIGSAGTVDLNNFGNTIGSLEGTGVITNAGATIVTLTTGALHSDTTFSGQISGALNLTKDGAGVQTLTDNGHTYTGSTTIGGGVLALTGAGALPIGSAVNVSSAAATFDISGVTATSSSIRSLAGVNASSVVLGDKELILAGSGNTNFAGVISGIGSVTINRTTSGVQTFSGANTYDGVTNINTGVLSVTNNSGLGSTAGNTIINFNAGTTTGGRLELSNNVTIGENILIQGTGDASPFGRAISASAGNNTINGVVTLNSTQNYRFGAAGAGTVLNLGLVQRSTASGGTITADVSAGATMMINQAIDNNGGQLTVHGGGGTLVLTAANNDVGNVVVQNFSTLQTTVSDSLAANRNLQIGNGVGNTSTGNGNDVGTYVCDGATQTVNALIGVANGGTMPNNATPSSSRRITSTTAIAKTLTIGNGNGSSTFDGVIEDGVGAGPLSIVKVGTGTQRLLGPSTYTGTTTIVAGNLAVNNTVGSGTGTGAVTVQSGGILSGSGFLGGDVTFQNGGSHNPGNSPGVQTFASNVNYDGGSVFNWELTGNTEAGRGVSFDGVDLTTGVLNINSGAISNLSFNSAGSNVLFADSFWDDNRQWLVFDNVAAPSPTVFGTLNVGLDSGGNALLATRGAFAWTLNSNDVFLSYTAVAVPEPATCGLLALLSAGVIARRRRKQRVLRTPA